MSKKHANKENYLDRTPVRNPAMEYTVNDQGLVTVEVEWTGFYHRVAQKFFHKPRVSQIHLDRYGSFVWLQIDGEKTVHRLSLALEEEFGGMEKSLARLIKFLEILHDHRFIVWKGEK